MYFGQRASAYSLTNSSRLSPAIHHHSSDAQHSTHVYNREALSNPVWTETEGQRRHSVHLEELHPGIISSRDVLTSADTRLFLSHVPSMDFLQLISTLLNATPSSHSHKVSRAVCHLTCQRFLCVFWMTDGLWMERKGRRMRGKVILLFSLSLFSFVLENADAC